MTAALLELTDASLGYDEGVVLSAVNLTVSAGEFVGVVGPNGSGKTTLIKSFVGLSLLRAGHLDTFGQPAKTFRQWWRIGYVPQHLTTAGSLPATVNEVVTSGRLARSRWFQRLKRADHRAVADAIERVGLTSQSQRSVHQLSGGQQRRTLIARALASDSELLLLDEPTAGVDVEAQASLAATLATLSQAGTTIVVVTHDLAPFESDLTRVVWVNQGRIEYDGPPTQNVLSAVNEPFVHHHEEDDVGVRSALPPQRGTLP